MNDTMEVMVRVLDRTGEMVVRPPHHLPPCPAHHYGSRLLSIAPPATYCSWCGTYEEEQR